MRTFSIRLLFVVTAIAALVFARVVSLKRAAQANDLAIQELIRNGLSVRTERTELFWGSSRLWNDLAFERAQWVRRPLTLGHHIQDSSISPLRKLLDLEVLSLHYTRITDDGLDSIPAAPSLRRLDLSGCKISDQGIAKLVCRTSLKELKLCSTLVMDECCKTIAAMPRLEKLDITNCKISDLGFQVLLESATLQEIVITYTQIHAPQAECIRDERVVKIVRLKAP